MYNISYSLIEYQIIENDAVLCSGTIPYDLLNYVRTLTETGSTVRKLKVNIDGNQSIINSIGYPIDTEHRHNQEAIKTYQLLQDYQILAEGTAKQLEANKWLAEQQEGERTIRITKALQKQATDSFNEYQQMILAQQQTTDEQIQFEQAEQQRQDEERITLVRSIAVNPITAITALQGEFSGSGDVLRQIAAVMERDINISKEIIQLPVECWLSSYEIMSVVGAQASEDHEFAQLVSDCLPDDSNLKTTLKAFGWAT